MDATTRLERGVEVAEKLRSARVELAEAEEAYRTAYLHGILEADGKTAEIRKAQADEFAGPMRKKVDELKAQVEYLDAHRRLIETTPPATPSEF